MYRRYLDVGAAHAIRGNVVIGASLVPVLSVELFNTCSFVSQYFWIWKNKERE